MSFKIGDKVRIKLNLMSGERYGGEIFKEYMKQYRGKQATIIGVDSPVSTYMIDIDNRKYWWSDDMLEPIEEPIIKDSGERTEYDTGAVRDCKEGKGRCDLMPLDVVAEMIGDDYVIININRFKHTKDISYLYKSIETMQTKHAEWKNIYDVLLETAKHFEGGAKKYGENNWQKGIPVHSYIDSAIRHYLKYKSGWDDEPHDRAFIWNIMCCIWTMNNKPEMDDFTLTNK